MREITLSDITHTVGPLDKWAPELIDESKLAEIKSDLEQSKVRHSNHCLYAQFGDPATADETLFYVPGFGGRTHYGVLWRVSVARAYARSRGQDIAVVVLDLPYEHPDRVINRQDGVKGLVGLYREIIHDLGPKNWSLAGYSVGAAIAAQLARQHEDLQPSRVVCIDPPSLVQRKFRHLVRDFFSPPSIRSWTKAQDEYAVYAALNRTRTSRNRGVHYVRTLKDIAAGMKLPNQRSMTHYARQKNINCLKEVATRHNLHLVLGEESVMSPGSSQFLREHPELFDYTTIITDADHGDFHRADILPWILFEM